MAKLYEITNDLRAIEEFECQGQDDLQALNDLFGEAHGALTDKVEGICKMLKNLDAESEALANEAKRLTDRKKTVENKIKSIKDFLKYQLKGIGLDKLSAGTFNLSIRSNPGSLKIVNPDIVPMAYKIQVYEVDNAQVKKAILDGNIVPGAIVEQGDSLTIR
jgi:hypothetical protein